MFSLNEQQQRTLRAALLSAFAFWLCNQIADSSLLERFWFQFAVLTFGAGIVRVCTLEAAKATHPR
jgi:hypothetical protein